MMLHGSGRRLRLTAVAAALLLSLTACATADDGAAAPESSAVAPSTAPASPSPTPEPPSSAEPEATPLAMEASTPVSVQIPALERDAQLIQTGLRADRTLEVPPDAEGSPASWYDGSPTPGELGTSVLLGHVNSLTSDFGVFYDLQSLVPGDEVRVQREDGSTAVFEIYRVESFAKDEFPTREVYYPASDAELRLITCDNLGGTTDGFPNNFIVFAKLVEAA
ncbi:class F sortase [Agrococcus sp. Marseille-P2731]|uniref:class F sortase n=1 Tax=Agrococcus sp. Marseille-P2731 TaxID=1841862 RepID=UPI00092FF5BD|nr:class F sortase [Agrococcus sp. Marseille-P2731]